MVATDAEVMGWVEKQLKDSPAITVDELFEGAKALKPDVGELNKRQFHARYPLQVKRRAMRAQVAAESGGEKARAPARSGTRTDPQVMSWVEAELKSNPEVSVADLLAGAVELNPEIGDLSKRQFHARYPLQVKRAARRAADAAAGIKPRRRRRTAPVAEVPAAPEVEASAAPAAAEEAAPAAAAPVAAAPVAAAPSTAGRDRDTIRKVLFGFAADVTAAQGKRGVVQVLAAIDDYVDQIA